ncbi:hypothetical protein ACFQ1S_44185, partial [Kibdelosporangium lantanae]
MSDRPYPAPPTTARNSTIRAGYNPNSITYPCRSGRYVQRAEGEQRAEDHIGQAAAQQPNGL